MFFQDGQPDFNVFSVHDAPNGEPRWFYKVIMRWDNSVIPRFALFAGFKSGGYIFYESYSQNLLFSWNPSLKVVYYISS